MNDPGSIGAQTLSALARLLPFNMLAKSLGNRLIAPFYHAVSDSPLPHIQHLYRVKSCAEFERDLDFLLKHYHPIDFHELPAIIDNPGSWKGKAPMLLSFDDGLQGFYDPIAPILLRKGIPAICFLNSGFIDNKDLFFRYKASLIIEALGQNCPPEKRRKLLSIGYADRGLLDAQAAEIGLDFEQFLQNEQPYLNTTQIETLIKQGFHFGAHSVDHPEYQFLPLEEQLRQTTKSTELISNKFGLGYRLFSFPFTDFGVSEAFFKFVLAEKKVADFSFGCAGLKDDVHPRHIQRIPFEAGHLSAEEILQKEFLYFWLKKPLGKNRISRS